MKKFNEILSENVLFDSHAHLSDISDLSAVIERANSAGVKYIFNMATKLSEVEKVIKISQEFKCVFPCIGIHPEECVLGFDVSGNLTEFENLCNKFKNELLMIGEIGLDYFVRENTIIDKIIQKKLFEKQLQLSSLLNLSVSVHVREAFSDAFEILKSNKIDSSEIVLHCFTGSYDNLKTAIDRGYYLGVNGIITYSGAKELRETFKKYLGKMDGIEPIDFYKKHILFETDSPLLRPSNARTEGKENEPVNTEKIFQYFKKFIEK